MALTDDELARAFWSAAWAAEWCSGNNPGKQKRLTAAANELRRAMRERGLDAGAIERAVDDGEMPPHLAPPPHPGGA